VNQFTLLDGNSLHAPGVDINLTSGCCRVRGEDAMVERDCSEREDRVAFIWLSAVTIILVFAFIFTAP
jgi:hypothetical protein